MTKTKLFGNINIIKHFALIAVIAAIVIFLSVLPFLSGGHFDGVLSLALLAQIIGAASIVLTPAGLAWLAYRHWKNKNFSALPLYLIFIPSIALIAQLALVAPLTERSRNIAIENSAEVISDIEAYHIEHGRYPASLFGVWPDYLPGIVGVSQYYYELNGEGYNLTFEQPRFLLDSIGTREFVMYNPRDEHAMTSHAARRLTQPELDGWYAVHDTSMPHWKYFLFD